MSFDLAIHLIEVSIIVVTGWVVWKIAKKGAHR